MVDPLEGRVVVGIDGTDQSVQALTWAMRVARDRGWTVDAVAAWPDASAAFVHDVPGHYCEPRGQAQQSLLEAVASASALVASPPRVVTHLENKHPVPALLARSRGAQLLVVGRHDASSQTHGRRRASVGDSCAAKATCPVVVVEGRAHPGGDASGA